MSGLDAKHGSRVVLEKNGADTVIRCFGSWTLAHVAHLQHYLVQLPWPETGSIIFDGSAISALDSAGAWLIVRTQRKLDREGHPVTLLGLRSEHEDLLRLIGSHAAAAKIGAEPEHGFLERTGMWVWPHLEQLLEMLSFIGETAMAALRSVVRPKRIRWRAILFNLQATGFNALPIVGLLAFLMGVVIAYQGAGQLARYGANIFVADLVGLSMLREMAPLLTAIVVAGRSGSAFAAQIGTMKVTEEIDALRTIGISPQDLLVLPKILALMLALPLLTVYADILGVFGGMVMAQTQLDVSYADFLDRFDSAVKINSFLVGIGKAPVFAAIIALVGCFQGFRASSSADSVGRQTTVSVVQSIFLIIVVDALFSVVFNWLKI